MSEIEKLLRKHFAWERRRFAVSVFGVAFGMSTVIVSFQLLRARDKANECSCERTQTRKHEN